MKTKLIGLGLPFPWNTYCVSCGKELKHYWKEVQNPIALYCANKECGKLGLLTLAYTYDPKEVAPEII